MFIFREQGQKVNKFTQMKKIFNRIAQTIRCFFGFHSWNPYFFKGYYLFEDGEVGRRNVKFCSFCNKKRKFGEPTRVDWKHQTFMDQSMQKLWKEKQLKKKNNLKRRING